MHSSPWVGLDQGRPLVSHRNDLSTRASSVPILQICVGGRQNDLSYATVFLFLFSILPKAEILAVSFLSSHLTHCGPSGFLEGRTQRSTSFANSRLPENP